MKLTEYETPQWLNETFFEKICKAIITNKEFKV